MEEIAGIYGKADGFCKELHEMKNDFQKQLNAILYGDNANNTVEPLKDKTNLTPQPEKKRVKRLSALDEKDENNATPNIPRPKKSALLETSTASEEKTVSSTRRLPRSTSRSAQKETEVTTTSKNDDALTKSASELMPPPMAPVAVSSSNSDQSHSRPQRAAKLICEKHLKEPLLNSKLRRPTNEDMGAIKVKLEHEQRASQVHEPNVSAKRVDSNASTASQDSVVALPTKELSIVSIASDAETIITAGNIEIPENTNQENASLFGRQLRVRIKREKGSFSEAQPKESAATNVESSIEASVLSTTTANSANTTQSKKAGRKKKDIPKPIKVERISDAGDKKDDTSIALRTRQQNKSLEKANEPLESVQSEVTAQRDASVYQEALENLPTSKNDSDTTKQSTPSSAVINETMSISKQAVTPSNEINSTMVLGAAPNDATYCTASAATFVLETLNQQPAQLEGGDLTFNVAKQKSTESRHSSMQSMATARDTLQPNNDSLITEDESFECPETPAPTSKKVLPQAPPAPKVAPKPNADLLSSAKKLPITTKSCKMPTRTIEIFNPLVQSPVKKKVEAYENAAAAQAASTGAIKRTRSKQIKDGTPSAVQSSSTTPLIGKLTTPALGRFLTPTQSSNFITPNGMAQAKAVAASASKALPIAKSNSAGNLKAMASSAKALSRENSADDFRKGLHQMAEERKKQREQKHLFAAQQREAKERERAERLAKVAKEREEKRLQKQQEAEQRKRELEEIQKKLRAQEDAAAAEMAKKKKLLMEQEKAKLKQMTAPKVPNPKVRNLPPQSKIQDKYTFEMLHEDDSTDDENKTSYKRPPPPLWSRSHVRGPSILQQQVMPTAVIDSFFSVQPMTPDLKTIFPAIDPRYLKRNSSVFWSTPPRYSELPKY